MRRSRIIVIVLGLLAIAVVVSSCQRATDVPTATSGSGAPPAIQLALRFSEPPILDKRVALTLLATPSSLVKKAAVKFYLPANLQVMDGMTEWSGTLAANETREFHLQVKNSMLGNWTVSGRVEAGDTTLSLCQKTVTLYVRSEGDKAVVSEIPLREAVVTAHPGPFPVSTESPSLSPEEKQRREDALNQANPPLPPLPPGTAASPVSGTPSGPMTDGSTLAQAGRNLPDCR